MRKLRLCIMAVLSLSLGSIALFAQDVAILKSDLDARNYFDRNYPNSCDGNSTYAYLGGDEYLRYYLGWTYVLTEAGIPFRKISDQELTESALNNYKVKVLILPNTPSMSDENTRAIHQWVLRGGRLLATFGSGYKDILNTDLRQEDTMKLQEGGTNGLHQLWKDPLTKLASSQWLSCTEDSVAAGDKTCCKGGPGDISCMGVDVTITRYEGPTAGLFGKLPNHMLGYGALGNMLVQRSINSDKVLAFMKFNNTVYDRLVPAIIVSDQAKGRAVYFSFAPEFIVALCHGLPADRPCATGDPVFCPRIPPLEILMKDTVDYLLSSR